MNQEIVICSSFWFFLQTCQALILNPADCGWGKADLWWDNINLGTGYKVERADMASTHLDPWYRVRKGVKVGGWGWVVVIYKSYLSFTTCIECFQNYDWYDEHG